PYDLTNADVDNDGKANARDALIILSAAVSLPTNGFRVGTTNTGACSVTAPVAIGLTPGVVALASGDRIALRLNATDAGGKVIAAPGAAWFSDNTAAATVDTAGRVTAVGNGTATISAMALG